MFHNILVPLDGSLLAECVLPHVVALARALDARILLVRVLEQQEDADDERPVDPVRWASRKAEAQAYLTTWINRLQEIGLTVDGLLRTGGVAIQIIDVAHGSDIDLIALSSHGASGLSNWPLSSVAQKILQRSQRSILLVRAYALAQADLTDLRYRRLMLPLDGSQRAEYVLPLAQRLAHSFDSLLLLTHVVGQPETRWRGRSTPEDLHLAQQLVEHSQAAGSAYLKAIQARLSVPSEMRLVVGTEGIDALHHLTDRESIDLTILTAHGHSGSPSHLFGSVAVNCIDYGNTPLLVVQDLALGHMNPTQAELAHRENHIRTAFSGPALGMSHQVQNMKIPSRFYHATSAEHVNTVEDEERIRPSPDGYVHLATKIDLAIGFAISKGYERVVVFKADPSELDGDKLQAVGHGCYLYRGDIRAPELVNSYRLPSPELTETLKVVSTKIDFWLTGLPPEQQGRFLEQLMKQGHGVVDHAVIDALGRSLWED